MGNGFSQIINMLIQCGSSALGWMESIFTSIGTLGLNSPKVLVRAMIVVMLSVRFILYPFLKGRVVGGFSEEYKVIYPKEKEIMHSGLAPENRFGGY